MMRRLAFGKNTLHRWGAVVAFALFTTVLPCEAYAHNALYFEGDAYFPTWLTKGKLESLLNESPQKTSLYYDAIDQTGGYLCGFVGYPEARFVSLDMQFVENLCRAYARAESVEPKQECYALVDGKIERREVPSVRVLFYPADFDLTQFHLGLRYNESWNTNVKRFGVESLAVRELTHNADALKLSQRDGPRVGSMNPTLPKLKTQRDAFDPYLVDDPVIIDSEVKAIVLLGAPLDDYSIAESGLKLLVVDSTGVVEYQGIDGHWVAVTRDKDSMTHTNDE